MLYKVFGSDVCPRCKKAAAKLTRLGHIVEHHIAAYHCKPQDDWRDRWVDYVELRAQLSLQNEELPVIYCVDEHRWIKMEEL